MNSRLNKNLTSHRNYYFSIVLLAVLLSLATPVFSQPFTREINSIPIIIHNDTLSQPFAGGIDGPNHRFVDIDSDDDYDLFIYDADMVVTFYRNQGTRFQANFVLQPNEIPLPSFTSWFTFVDLNDDGKIDLVTDNGGNSAKYYTNQGTLQIPDFVLHDSPMRDTSGSSIQTGYIGIPTFTDIDGDDDFDFMISNFDGSITYYQNIGTPTSPLFRYADGRFQGVAILNDSCRKDGLFKMTKDIKHGGSILEFGDLNNDGAIDLLIGDLNSNSMFFIPNNGNATTPELQCSDSHYPPDNSLYTSGYNKPSLIDIDGDNDLDLFIGAFVNMGPTNMQRHSFWFYENTGDAEHPNFILITKDYLSMLDAGRNAHPAFLDINRDGKTDMVIGTVAGQLWYLENTGTVSQPAFTLVDTMFLGIKGNFSYAPMFVDLDGDGKRDFVLGKFDQYVRYYHYNDTALTPHFESKAYDSLYVSGSSLYHISPAFTDIDGDQDYDLFVGTSDGRIRFYRNIGSKTMFTPSLVTTFFDSIDLGEDANPFFIDIDHDNDDDLFVGNAEGKLFFYENTGSGEFVERTNLYGNIHPLKESAPSFTDIDNDGDLDLFIGTFTGGVHFYRNSAPNAVEEPNPVIQLPTQITLEQNYPNPFNPVTVIRYSLSMSGMVTLKVYNILGEEVATLVNAIETPGSKAITWDASVVPSGVYSYTLTVGTFTQTKKLLLLR